MRAFAIDYSEIWSNLHCMDKLQAMQTFVQIVDTGSLTAAANALDTSLPTVVRTLATLERQLGVTLLNRTTRRSHLTDEGAQYLERCRVILSATQEAEANLVSRRIEPEGKLSITASVLFGRRYVAPILFDFLQNHPKISADMLFLDRVVNLIEEGVDIAVRIANLKDSSLVVIPVGQVRRVVCASEQYLSRYGVPRAPNDVRKHRCVRHVGLVPRSEWHFRLSNRHLAVPITSVLNCNDIDSAVAGCIRGMGLGMFLSYMVAPNKNRGELKYVLEKFETKPMQVQVVYPQSKRLSSKVRAFVDECVSKLRRVEFD
jgi:DNA-binding transcriptional LysR family regulator